MKITAVRIERVFNLGNYESEKICFEAQLGEFDKPLEVTADLEMLCHQHMQNMKAKTEGTATTQTVKPAPQVTANPTPKAPADHILSGLPKELSDQLTTIKENGQWKISVNSYLKPQDYNKVKEYLAPYGGKYHLATNDEHGYWTAPVKA